MSVKFAEVDALTVRTAPRAVAKATAWGRGRPDFFILGAPKCGTTSLAAWLETSPQVFMCPVKEPHFFNTDDRQGVADVAAYEALFRGVRPSHRAVGEASVWYLYSSEAVRNILRYRADARFIVLLRNPIEMAPALHGEMLLSGHESVRDFSTAWRLQNQRRQGRRLPAFGWATRRLLYGDVCALGAQLQRLLQEVPANQVLAVVLDDVIEDPRREYLRVLRFLGVEDDGRTDFPTFNRAKVPRWPQVARAMFVVTQIKRRLGIDLGLNAWSRVFEINRVERPRAPLPAETSSGTTGVFQARHRAPGAIARQGFGTLADGAADAGQFFCRRGMSSPGRWLARRSD